MPKREQPEIIAVFVNRDSDGNSELKVVDYSINFWRGSERKSVYCLTLQFMDKTQENKRAPDISHQPVFSLCSREAFSFL